MLACVCVRLWVASAHGRGRLRVRAGRRACVRALTLAAGAATARASAQTASWPNGPVALVCPYPAGGPVDVVARLLAPAMANDLGQTIAVDNRGGGAGAIGTLAAARAEPATAAKIASDVALARFARADGTTMAAYASWNTDCEAIPSPSAAARLCRDDANGVFPWRQGSVATVDFGVLSPAPLLR